MGPCRGQRISIRNYRRPDAVFWATHEAQPRSNREPFGCTRSSISLLQIGRREHGFKKGSSQAWKKFCTPPVGAGCHRLPTLKPNGTYRPLSRRDLLRPNWLAVLVTPRAIRSCNYRTRTEAVIVLIPVKAAVEFALTTTMSVTVAGTPPLPAVIVTWKTH